MQMDEASQAMALAIVPRVVHGERDHLDEGRLLRWERTSWNDQADRLRFWSDIVSMAEILRPAGRSSSKRRKRSHGLWS